MRILHWYPNFMCGGSVARTVASLASYQARSWGEVTIACKAFSGAPLYGALELSEAVQVLQWSARRAVRAGRFSLDFIDDKDVERLTGFRPDIGHIHGEFNPNNIWAPKLLSRPCVLA